MEVSIITPLWNRLELTRACIESLQRTVRGEEFEWIFIDDGSTDGTREFLRTLPNDGRFRVVCNDTPRGFAANNNLGARLARAPLLCLLNNDTVLLPGWLEPMARLARLLPDVACVGNVQREPISGLIDHAGVFFRHDGYAQHAGKDEPAPPAEDYLEWPVVTAACCVVRRQVFLELGGFDETFRNGSEDVDFCLRAGLRGYRHFVANRSVIYHYISSSPGRMRHEDANQRLFRERWLERLQTELAGRRTSAQNRRQGRAYLRKHWWRPWRYNGWRLCRAAEQLVAPLPSLRSLDRAPRLFFQAQDFFRRRRSGASAAAAARLAPPAANPIFLVVGDTVQTAERSGVQTAVRRLAAACGRLGAPVRPVAWKTATRSLCLLPPEFSIGLDAEALRPPAAPAPEEEGVASICDPAVGDLHGQCTDTPSLHELIGSNAVPAGAWILWPEVWYGERAGLLVDYVRRHGWRLAVILYDTMRNNEPQYFPLGAANDHERYLRTISRADLVLPVSRFVADDWQRYVQAKGLPSPECHLCMPGTDLCPQPRRGEPATRASDAPVRVLCVSQVTPRKNHRVLIDAFEIVFASRPDLAVELCLVGQPHLFNADNVPDAVARFVDRHPERVRWIHRVEYGALCLLYDESDFTVYPSLLEGRGFPITESLWFGRPCICGNVGALAETARGGGCLTVDVRQPAALAEAIVTLAVSPDRRAALRAEIAARRLRTWEDYAGDLLVELGSPQPAARC